jgi:hypothetical protein
VKGAAAVFFGLIALQVVITTPLARFATALAYPAQLAVNWMSPAVPLIPARSAAGSGPAPPAASSAPPRGPVAAPRIPVLNPTLRIAG